MPDKSNNSLFFIASPHYKLSAIERFLKKRNYKVHIETDIKAGLLKLIELRPDFVFIAVDHPNSKMSVLPQIIDQCLTINIIPFSHSSSKEAMKKLDECIFINKIFPPFSGPAIERMALKLGTRVAHVEKKTIPTQGLDHLISGYLSELNEKQNSVKVHSLEKNKEKLSQLKKKNSFYSKAKKNLITSLQKNNLQSEFKTKIKSELADILETYQQEDNLNLISLNKEQKTIYCLLVESEAWSGHLMAYSNVTLESHLLEPVFMNWISQEFKYFNDQESHVFFEIEINLHDFKIWVENKSEYFEVLKVNETELMMSFVGIEPTQLLLEFDEENDLIEVPLDVLPLETDLTLNLFLHLPENKKYLLYTPLNQQISPLQKQRLIENKVEKLFSPIEFEPEVKKMKMKKYLNSMIDGTQSELPE